MHWIVTDKGGTGRKPVYHVGIVPHDHDAGTKEAIQVIWTGDRKDDVEIDKTDKKIKIKIKPPKAVKSEKKNDPVS